MNFSNLTYRRRPVFRTGTYSNFPLIRRVVHSPLIFLIKLMQPSISYSNLGFFEISYIQSEFLFPLTENPSVIRSFSRNSELHCLKRHTIYRNTILFTAEKRFYSLLISSCNIFIILQFPVNCSRQGILLPLLFPKFTTFPVILT